MTSVRVTTDAGRLPGAPDIPGLTFRRFRGESDYPAMAAILERSNDADRVEWVKTVEEYAHEFAHLTNCDPARDVLLAKVDGGAIAYNRAEWWKEAEGARIYFHYGFLLPEWRRKGIGRAMLRDAERRLRAIAADHPENGPRYLQSFAWETQPGTVALLLGEGYTAVRHEFTMLRPTLDDIPEAPLPPGLEVRPARPEHHRAIWAACHEAFRDHWGYRPPAESDYQRWVKDPDLDPSLWQVAWDGDQVAGMVLGFILDNENAKYNRARGYAENVCVRRPWRRHGLARALLVRTLRALAERGCTEAALTVDTENRRGALGLYESAGFRTTMLESTYRKPMESTCVQNAQREENDGTAHS